MHRIDEHPSAQARSRAAGIVLGLIAVVGWLVASGVGVRSAGSIPAPGPDGPGPMLAVAQSSHVVQPGDTLWSLARRLQPGGDVRPLVHELSRRTAGRPLRAGQRIELPPVGSGAAP